MERKELKNNILKASGGLLESVTDFVLHSLYYFTEVLDRPTMNTVLTRAEWVADKELSKFNYQTIKRAISQLQNDGFINNGKITPAGRNHLAEVLPSRKLFWSTNYMEKLSLLKWEQIAW